MVDREVSHATEAALPMGRCDELSDAKHAALLQRFRPRGFQHSRGRQSRRGRHLLSRQSRRRYQRGGIDRGIRHPLRVPLATISRGGFGQQLA